MIKYTSFYDRVFTGLHNSSVRLIRHFFLIPLGWRIRQILLYFDKILNILSRGSQTFSGHVGLPLQWFHRLACTPKISYDKKAEVYNKNIFTNKFAMIFENNIHWHMYNSKLIMYKRILPFYC